MKQNVSNGSVPTNPLENGMGDINNKLESQRMERKKMCVEHILDAFLDAATDKSAQIMQIMATSNSWKIDVKDLVCEEVVSATKNNLSVPHYIPSARAEQEVFIYEGTHWQLLDLQQYYDFVRACSRKIGMSERQLNDPSFMNGVFWQVAFRVSHNHQTHIPDGEAWINMQNGTLELHKNGDVTFREHRREDYFGYVLPYIYNKEAVCPRWEAFLNQMLPDADTQRTLGEYIGYCFTRDIKAEKMLVLYGLGSNGKSVILDTVESLFGSNNVSNVSLSDLTNDPEKRSNIEGKLVNISRESDRELKVDTLKTLVSGEPVLIRVLYKGSREMKQYAKLMTSFNVLPRSENTYGWFRRWILVPFKVTIAEEDADLDLSIKLQEELSGILNWVLEKLRNFLKKRAFTISQECKDALHKYKLSSDNVQLFVMEHCEKNYPYNTPGMDLYKSYKNACNGDGLKPLGKQNFYEHLESIPGIKRTDVGTKPMFNLRITDDDARPF